MTMMTMGRNTLLQRLRTVSTLLALVSLSRHGFYQASRERGLAFPLGVQFHSGPAQPTPTPRFDLVNAAVCRKKDGSRAKHGQCGEDSYTLSQHGERSLLAVADGVGGWGEHGGDSSAVSNGFMRAMDRLHGATDWPGLPGLIKGSFDFLIANRSLKMGTTTICAAAFHHASGDLEVSNIGDSQLLVLRDGAVLLEVEAGVWAFNSPNQVGFGLYGEPQGDIDEMNIEKRISLVKGDVIVIGTDGLFDNVFVSSIARIVREQLERSGRGTKEAVQAAAQALLKEAYKNGLDDHFFSPFAKEAIAAKKAPSHYRGGKPDDISIIVSLVVQ